MKKRNLIEQKIVEKAQGIFSRLGFKKTTMEDIARAVCKTKSSLYHYFKSKEEIFRAVVEKEAKMLKKEIKQALALEESPVNKLKAYAKSRVKALRRLANFYQAFREEYLESYGFIQKIRHEYDQYEINAIKNILQEGVKAGVFDVKDLDLSSEAILMALKGYEYVWAVLPDINKIESDIDRLFNILFYGILKR